VECSQNGCRHDAVAPTAPEVGRLDVALIQGKVPPRGPSKTLPPPTDASPTPADAGGNGRGGSARVRSTKRILAGAVREKLNKEQIQKLSRTLQKDDMSREGLEKALVRLNRKAARFADATPTNPLGGIRTRQPSAQPAVPFQQTMASRTAADAHPRVYYSAGRHASDAAPSVPLTSQSASKIEGKPTSADGIFFGTHRKLEDGEGEAHAAPYLSPLVAAASAPPPPPGQWVSSGQGFHYVKQLSAKAGGGAGPGATRPEIPNGLQDGGHFADIVTGPDAGTDAAPSLP